MQQTLRPYVTAGIAIVGSGLIAATPVTTPLASVPNIRDVALTAGGTLPDLMAPWSEVFNRASDNASQLLNNYYLAPGVGFQQFLANQGDFWNSMINDPSTIPSVMQQMQANLDAVLTGFTLINASGGGDLNGFTGTIGDVVLHTLSGTDTSGLPVVFGHDLLFALLPAFLPADQSALLTPIINFMASPMSGMIMGAIGPSIAPWVAMMNSIQDGDGLNQIMASWMDGYLNGATLNLDSLIPIIEQSGLLPMPEGTITHLDFAFGGLLSGGDVASGPWETADEAGNVVDSVPAVGGSIFNSLGIGLNAAALGLPLQITIDSHGIGPIGAWEAWSQTVGSLLGSGWDGKDPVVVTPPGAGIDLPNLPVDTPDIDDGGAGTGAASEFQDMLDALVEALGS